MNAWLYDTVLSWIPNEARVLDLGCGDGWFLELLRDSNSVPGEGVERDSTLVTRCIQRGITVHHGDLLDGLEQHPDLSFDYVLLLGTFQELWAPEIVLRESFRVGKQVILGHLNFAYYKYRWQLSFGGRTPRTDEQALPWYNSPNIQLFSIDDFIRFCGSHNIKRCQSAFFNKSGPLSFLPNIRTKEALWLLESQHFGNPGKGILT